MRYASLFFPSPLFFLLFDSLFFGVVSSFIRVKKLRFWRSCRKNAEIFLNHILINSVIYIELRLVGVFHAHAIMYHCNLPDFSVCLLPLQLLRYLEKKISRPIVSVMIQFQKQSINIRLASFTQFIIAHRLCQLKTDFDGGCN